MIKKLLAAVAAVLIVVGVAVYFLVLKDDPAPELSINTPTKSGETTTTAADSGQTVGVDGTWTVDAAAPDNAVGFRIEEKFIGGAAQNTAVGRTSTVSGTMTITTGRIGATVTKAGITANLTKVEFTDSPARLDVANRKKAIASAGLETDTFPDAAFKLTKPIDLSKLPTAGTVVDEEPQKV